MKKLYIQRILNETKVVLTEDNKPVEFWMERTNKKGRAGSIYKGIVENVLPGMAACFVDIGLNKNAFLYVDEVYAVKEINRHKTDHRPTIQQLVRQGEEIIVQINKESTGNKGPKVTTNVALPGRYLVYLPYGEYVGISRKIGDDKERDRLRRFGESVVGSGEGLIIRTACERIPEEELVLDFKSLRRQWESLLQEASHAEPRQLIYEEKDTLSKVVRDLLTTEIECCVVNDGQAYSQLLNKVSAYPDLRNKIEPYTGKENMLEHYGLSQELEKATRRKIWLKNGGYVMIDQTEALTAIDVNTGKFTGKQNLEQTILQANLEAAREIARQLRLRDIGGIVIIDFIDMAEQDNREKVIRTLEESVKQDRTKVTIVGLTALGLVELTRMKIRQSLQETLTKPCRSCEGTGRAVSEQTVVYKLKEMLWEYRYLDTEAMLIEAHPNVAKELLQNHTEDVEELEIVLGFKLYFYYNGILKMEEFSVLYYGPEQEVKKKLKALLS